MSKINEVYKRVLDILRDTPFARENDPFLIAKVDSMINPLVADMPYSMVMVNRAQFGLPSCESIVRARRKAQENFPELKPSKAMQEKRLDEQIEYEAFAVTV